MEVGVPVYDSYNYIRLEQVYFCKVHQDTDWDLAHPELFETAEEEYRLNEATR